MEVGATRAKSLLVQMTVEIGDDLAHDVDLDALATKSSDLRVDLSRCAREIGHGGGAIDAPRDELRIAGQEAQEVDVLEDADESAVLRHRDTPLVVLGHSEQRGRDEIVGGDADDRLTRKRPDRTFDAAPLEDRRVEQV